MYEFFLFFGGAFSYKVLSHVLSIKKDLTFFLRTYKILVRMTVFILKAAANVTEQQKEFYTRSGMTEQNTELLVNFTETEILKVYSDLEKNLYNIPNEYKSIAKKVILSEDYPKYILEASMKLGAQSILYAAINETEHYEQKADDSV